MKSVQVHLHPHSLRFRIFLLLMVLILLFSTLVCYNNFSAFSLLRRNVYRNTENALILYQQHLDDTLDRTETWLYTSALSNTALFTLKYTDGNTTDWFKALSQLKTDFGTAMNIYTANGFFCYLPTHERLITQSGQASELPIRQIILETIAEEDSDFFSWNLFRSEESYYLLRILYIDHAYVGAWVSLDTMLDSLVGEEDRSSLVFSGEDGSLYRSLQPALSITPPEQQKEAPYAAELIDGEKMFAVSRRLESGECYLTLLIPYADITNANTSLYTVLAIVFFSLLIIWILLFLMLNQWILRPVSDLTAGSSRLRAGNLETHVVDKGHLDEFQNMTSAFNDMVCEIKDLKIDVYERKLRAQNLEAQFLKQQITPHFLINCLNTAYQLTETDHPELARKMLRDLSQHLRYTLSSGQTVTLGEELELVRNYIELSGIRYPNCLALSLDCPDGLLQASVVPLLILNFVENTIKYEVVMGQLLEIHIEISPEPREDRKRIHIRVWDSGKGFSPDILAELQNIDAYLESEDYHIGITNVILRARHVFHDPKVSFSNHPDAGAQIDIDLPFLPIEQKSPVKEADR